MKKILIVIIISILIGVGIVWFTKGSAGEKNVLSNVSPIFSKAVPTPSPSPTLPPFDENSNLEAEVEKLTPEDFSKDFEDLRKF